MPWVVATVDRLERLGDGKRNGEELQKEAEGEDISRRTLRRAAKELGVVIGRDWGEGGRWYWSLPKESQGSLVP